MNVRATPTPIDRLPNAFPDKTLRRRFHDGIALAGRRLMMHDLGDRFAERRGWPANEAAEISAVIK